MYTYRDFLKGLKRGPERVSRRRKKQVTARVGKWIPGPHSKARWASIDRVLKAVDAQNLRVRLRSVSVLKSQSLVDHDRSGVVEYRLLAQVAVTKATTHIPVSFEV